MEGSFNADRNYPYGGRKPYADSGKGEKGGTRAFAASSGQLERVSKSSGKPGRANYEATSQTVDLAPGLKHRGKYAGKSKNL